jgi:malate permease and related proteins
LGDDALAWGALADIGNKVFVLIIAYMIAIKWYFQLNKHIRTGNGEKIKSLMISLINEPINIVIILALLLISLDVHLDTLPEFVSSAIITLSNLMTPLVLIFIGVGVVFNWKQIRKIAGLLMVRSGLTFLLSGLILIFAPQLSYPAIMVLVVFPQSAISFWPFAHMASITALEQNQESRLNRKTFDMELAVNILAISLPFSILVMLVVFSFGEFFASSSTLLIIGLTMVGLGIIKPLLQWFNIIDYNPVLEKRSSVIDANDDLTSILQISYCDIARQRQTPVSRRHGVHIVDFTAGSGTAMKLRSIPGSKALFLIPPATFPRIITLPVDFIKRGVPVRTQRL